VRSIVKIRKMKARSQYRKRLRMNAPRRGVIANIPSSWYIHGYKLDEKENEMNIQELTRFKKEPTRLKNVNLKTVGGEDVYVNLVEGWTRLFESQGMSHSDAEKQAQQTVAQDQDSAGDLIESLKKAGFTEDQMKYFLEGRGGADDLTETYLEAKKKNLLEGEK
jgi:DNA-binding protein H-NS